MVGLRERGDGASTNQGRTEIEAGDMPGPHFYGVQCFCVAKGSVLYKYEKEALLPMHN